MVPLSSNSIERVLIVSRETGSRSRWVVRGAVCAYAVGATLVLTPVGAATSALLGGQGDGGAPPAPVLAPALPDVSGASIGLVEGQLRVAETLTAADPTLAAALKGVGYGIEKSGPWTTVGREGARARRRG